MMAAQGDISSFEDAVTYVSSHYLSFSRDELLRLYSFYKQATVGTCNTPKPGWFSMETRKKWDAWFKLGTMSKEEAKKKYVEFLNETKKRFTLEDEKHNSRGWVFVSSLCGDVENDTDKSSTVLDCVKENDLDKLMLLAKDITDINSVDDQGMTLLHWAADRGFLQSVRYLVEELKADVDCQDAEGQTPLHYASFCGHEYIIAYLLEVGARTDIKDNNNCTAFDVACSDNILHIFHENTSISL